ncbi:MAG: lysophospholipase [Chloroflexi bacterium]|nr:MAG: lysophospholipase [Chloroflexota bacterium]
MATARAGPRVGRLRSLDGTHLFWRAWEVTSPRATFAVIHGLGEHSGRYESFASAMAKRQFSTFAVDLRGMGKSEGTRGHVESWSEWVQDAAALVAMIQDHPSAGEVIPVGHSFGGVVLLSAVIREAILVRRFVLSSPALQPKVRIPTWKLKLGRLTSSLLPRLTMSNEVDPSTVSRDPAVVRAYQTDRLVHDKISSRLFTEWTAACDEAYRRANEIRTPFLLILGEADRLVDPAGGHRLADLVGSAAQVTVKQYPERYHEPFNDLDAGQVFDDLAEWAAARPAPPGS